MRRTLAVSVIAGLLLTLSACGSKDETSTASNNPSAKSSEQTTTSSTAKKSSEDSTDNGSDENTETTDLTNLPDVLGGDCLAVATLYAQVMAQTGNLFGTSVSDEDLQKLDDEIASAKAKVPDEIKDAFDTWSTAWGEFSQKVGDISNNGGMMDPANAAKLEEASAILDAPDVKAANDQLESYFNTKCSSGN